MKRDEIEKLFDFMANLDPGKEICIPFESKNSAEAARVSLYRQKGLYKKITGKDASFSISTDYSKEAYHLTLRKEKSIGGFFVVRDGKVIETVTFASLEKRDDISQERLQESIEEELENEEPTEEEIKKSIIQYKKEGKTDEDIEEMFKNELPHYAGYKWRDLL